MANKIFAERVKAMREKQNLTVTQLAAKLGIQKTRISMWETNGTVPRQEMLLKLCNLFNVSADYLLGNDRTDGGNPHNEKIYSIQRLLDTLNDSELDKAKDILNASTEVRSFTGIDYEKGVAKEGSLRRVRVIRKGLYFYSHILTGRDLSSFEEDIMGIAAASLKHLGTMETRGMGYVSCRLMKGQENLTDQSMTKLREGILDEISVL